MTKKDKTPDNPDEPIEGSEPEAFGDKEAGPEESQEVTDDPENQAAAKAIRESTLTDDENGSDTEES